MVRVLRPLVLIFLSLLSPWTTRADDVVLPDIGDPASAVLSPSQEALVGVTLLREIRRSLPLIDDPELNAYIQSLGLRLVSSSPDAHQSFAFLIVQDPLINAFATPGGIVVVNSGLMLAAENEAELAAVMAHEIAHVTQRHLARLYAKSDTVNLATGLAILAAIIASAYDPQVGQAALFGTMAASAQSQINFTRANEQEADRTGIQTLANTGFDPKAMATFFDKLQRQSYGDASSVTDYLRTHPVTSSRISDSTARADQLPGKYTRDSIEFRLAQARLRVLSASTPQTIIERLDKTPPKPEAALLWTYERALALTRAGNAAAAARSLGPIASAHPDLLPVQLAQAQALFESGSRPAALEKLARLNELFPHQEPVTVAYAQGLIDSGRAKDALKVMEAFTRETTAGPVALKLKAEAAERAGETALSHETLADYYILYGQFGIATEQLNLALRAPGIDDVTEARLREKRDSLLRARMPDNK